MVKITGGKYRSRTIDIPDQGTVPTKSMVREAIFSAVRGEIEDAAVLDLFSGSGALGIETLSRGARRAYLCDMAEIAIRTIRGNLSKLGENNATVVKGDYLYTLNSLKGTVFDLVLLDPPYAMKDSYQKSVTYLLENQMLSEHACLVLEYEGELEIDRSPFASSRDYNYGRTKVLILRK